MENVQHNNNNFKSQYENDVYLQKKNNFTFLLMLTLLYNSIHKPMDEYKTNVKVSDDMQRYFYLIHV